MTSIEKMVENSESPLISVIDSETLEGTIIFTSEIKQKGIQTGLYEHFKGKRYEVIGMTERDSQEFVVYKALYMHKEYGENSIWMRSKNMFFEEVTRDGKTSQRFKYIGEKK